MIVPTYIPFMCLGVTPRLFVGVMEGDLMPISASIPSFIVGVGLVLA